MDDPPFGEGAELFVHPGETVQIPFKYQSFSVANDNQIDGADGVHAIKVCPVLHVSMHRFTYQRHVDRVFRCTCIARKRNCSLYSIWK